MEFGGEQEEILVRAFAALHGFGAPHGLKVSVGIVMPPFFVDLIALPLAITRDPVRIAAFVAVLNLLGLALFGDLVRRLLGARTGLWTAVLLASMPWAVLFSRKIWAQDCQFPVVAAFLWLFFSSLERYARWKTWLAFLALGLLLQVYPSTWFMVPPLVAFAILFRVRIDRSDALAGLALFALLYARWIAHQIGCGFDDLAWFWHARHSPGHPAFEAGARARETLLWPLRATSGGGFEYEVAGVGAPAWFLAAAATGAAILFAVGWTASRILRRGGARSLPRGEQLVVLSTLVVLTLVGAGVVLRAAPVPHYAVLLHPFLALLLVWAIGRVPSPAGSWARPAIASLALANLAFVDRFQRGVAEHPEGRPGAYGIPYAPREEHWDRRLAAGFDDVLHGEESRRASEAIRAANFAQLRDVLVHVDCARNEPAIGTQGPIEVEPSPRGLLVRGGGFLNLLVLPEFALPSGSVAEIRVRIRSPVETNAVFLYATSGDTEISRRQKEAARVRAGTSELFVKIPSGELVGRVLVRVEAYRFTIEDLEVRAAPPDPRH
jgi:hypothetical protein